MTIAQLKKRIEHLPDNMDVFVAERETGFTYGLVNSAEVKKIKFYEQPEDETPLSEDEVFILSEV